MTWFRLSVVAVLLCTGCATGEDGNPLQEVSRHLRELRSGLVELRVIARDAAADPVTGGFELIGSFQTGEDELALADVRYRDLAAPERPEERLTSTGDAAFIRVSGQAYELPEDQTFFLRAGPEGHDPLFEDVEIERWVADPTFEEGEGLDGAAIHRVTGTLRVVQAAGDLLGLAGRLGRPRLFEPLEGPDAHDLADAVQSGQIEMILGAEDQMLRRVLIEVEIGGGDHPVLGIFGGLAGRSLTLDLSISQPNHPVTVEAPANTLPFGDLDHET